MQQALNGGVKAVGYIGPDYTAIAATPTLASGVTSAPFVASVQPAGSSTYYLPNIANTTAALASFTFTPVATDPSTFGVLVPAPTNGYPIVGYTNVFLSSKYSSAAKVSIVKTFLSGLYNQDGSCGQCVTDINNSGFVPVPGVKASAPPGPASKLAAGLTILLAEQGLEFSLALADRVYVLEKGTVRHAGPSSELRNDRALADSLLAL